MRTKLNSVVTILDRTSAATWFIGVMCFAMLERILLWLLYRPVSYGDSNSYWRLAEGVRGGFKVYDATRTPGYPALLAVFDTPEKVWVVQTVMGLIVTGLLFYTGWRISGRGWLGGLAALANCLNLGQLFFEPAILSETAATFWITLAFAGLTAWLYARGCRQGIGGAATALGLGLCVSLAWLTRTLFIYLPFWTLFTMLIVRFPDDELTFTRRWLPKAIRLPALFYLLPVVAALGGWLGWMKYTYGEWSLTTMTGYHMIQHTGVFFELAPDEYAGLRDTYLKYRDQQIASRGSPANAIWDAIPEMQEVSGLSFFDLSRTLARISTQMILDHPGLYLKNVAEGWWYFWRAPVYWQPEAVRYTGVVLVIRALVLVSRLSEFVVNMLFLTGTVAAALWKDFRKKLNLPAILWHVAGSVWVASILQTLADHGDNPRFLVPLQPLVTFWVLYFAYSLIRYYLNTPEWRKIAAAGVRSL